jgi:hypothetical protein
VVDRIAVIVGKRVIKSSDIARDIRVTAFLNNETPSFGVAARRKSADRLIDQQLIREQIERGGYTPATDAGAASMLATIREGRLESAARFRNELAKYQITEEDLRRQLLLQLTVLRFIDQRFRPGVLVTDEEIKSYYEQHLDQLRKENPANYTFQALEPKIRSLLEGQRVNENFEQWLADARKRARIEYRHEAFL